MLCTSYLVIAFLFFFFFLQCFFFSSGTYPPVLVAAKPARRDAQSEIKSSNKKRSKRVRRNRAVSTAPMHYGSHIYSRYSPSTFNAPFNHDYAQPVEQYDYQQGPRDYQQNPHDYYAPHNAHYYSEDQLSPIKPYYYSEKPSHEQREVAQLLYEGQPSHDEGQSLPFQAGSLLMEETPLRQDENLLFRNNLDYNAHQHDYLDYHYNPAFNNRQLLRASQPPGTKKSGVPKPSSGRRASSRNLPYI